MTTLKTLLSLAAICLGFFLLVGLAIQNYQLRAEKQQAYDLGYRDGYNYIKSISELQMQVGAEPDSIIGPNTIALYGLAFGQQSANYSINNNTMGVKK